MNCAPTPISSAFQEFSRHSRYLSGIDHKGTPLLYDASACQARPLSSFATLRISRWAERRSFAVLRMTILPRLRLTRITPSLKCIGPCPGPMSACPFLPGRRKRPLPTPSSTPAPTGKRRFFVLNLTPMGRPQGNRPYYGRMRIGRFVA